MIIPVYIPFVNRRDLLDKAAESCNGDAHVTVINNSGRSTHFYYEKEPPVPLTFAQTQNWMLKLSDNVPFYLFMHSDAEAGEGTVRKLVEMATDFTEQGRKWGVIFTAYDALAAFNTQAFNAVGGWDQEIPWYLADCSIYRKLRIAGYELIDSGLPVKHTPSQTLNSDPRIARFVQVMTPAWRAWYREMWGGDNEHETYTVPFNGRLKDRSNG
jgi:hypothetical protein